MDLLLHKITTKLSVSETDMSALYASAFAIPEVDLIISRVHKDACFDAKFPFFALFYFMSLGQCDMFMRSLAINFFKYDRRVLDRKEQLFDKARFYELLVQTCNVDDASATIFVQTIANFV